MKIQNLLFVLLLVIGVSCKTEKANEPEKNVTVLKGEIINRKSSKLLIAKRFEDARHDAIDSIMIVDGKFNYEISFDNVEAYNLVFEDELMKGAWRPIIFFSEPGTINFKLYPMDEGDKNEVTGGKLNAEYANYMESIIMPFYNKINSIYVKYSGNNKDDLNSDKQMNGELEKLANEINDIEFEKIMSKASPLTYFLLLNMIDRPQSFPLEKVKKAYSMMAEAYPNHPYTELGLNLINSKTMIKSGGKYVNFTAPDINGKQFEFKDILAQNEIVLLDLWATWCGPCISKTRKVIPVYEQYKDKGFAILGVAGEHKNLDAYKSFMKKNKWEWLNLIELDRENKIWEKYGAMNAGGAMFLIDKSGEILAANPDEKEVAAILKERL